MLDPKRVLEQSYAHLELYEVVAVPGRLHAFTKSQTDLECRIRAKFSTSGIYTTSI